MTKTPPKQYSRFAKALEGLFEETGLFSYEGWAYVLLIPIETPTLWITDELLPRGEALRQMLDIFSQTDQIPQQPLKAFEELMDLPANEITPLHGRMMPNLRTYIKETKFSGAQLRGLTLQQQQIVLTRCSWPKECC